MDDLISRQAAIDALGEEPLVWHEDDAGEVAERNQWRRDVAAIKALPSAQPERKKDIIQKFHDYQVEWLKSHYDIKLEPQLEEMIVRFLHDTANCYMMEVEHGRPD